jgi:hypothetical protein
MEEIEVKIKPPKKPRGRPVPERAKVHESPGACYDCTAAKATDAGWYCATHMRALSTNAKTCKDFVGDPNTQPDKSEEKATAENATAENATAEKAATEKDATEKAAAEKAAAEKAAAEKAASVDLDNTDEPFADFGGVAESVSEPEIPEAELRVLLNDALTAWVGALGADGRKVVGAYVRANGFTNTAAPSDKNKGGCPADILRRVYDDVQMKLDEARG